MDQPRTPAVSYYLLQHHLHDDDSNYDDDHDDDHVDYNDCNEISAGCHSLQRSVWPSRVSPQENAPFHFIYPI